MSQNTIPEDIRRFVLTNVPSVTFLEALILVNANPHIRWDSIGIAKRLYINDKAALELLATLYDLGIVTQHKAEQETLIYDYEPGSEERSQLINRLADAYAKNILEITQLIHSKMDRKAQQFADAFKWRKDS